MARNSDAFTHDSRVAQASQAARCAAVLLVLSQAAVAQDAPRLCVVAADADTGAVHAMGDFPGGMLIGAEKGLFLAREAGGKVTVEPAGDGDTGRVLAIHAFPGGALIGAWSSVFVARQAGGTISVVDVTDCGHRTRSTSATSPAPGC